MNKEYMCVRDNVIVKDDSGLKKIVPYQDNIEEILISENRIEELENKKKEVCEEIESAIKREDRPKTIKFLSNCVPFVLGIVAPLLTTQAFSWAGIAPDILMIIERISIITLLFTFAPSVGATIENFVEEKNAFKHATALCIERNKIEKNIQNEKSKLIKLQKNNQNSTKPHLETKEINNNNIKQEINDFCDLYYDCSYNIEKYYNYYLTHGELPHKLQKRYNLEGQQLIKEHIEDKGPVLVKTLNNKRK